MIIKRYLPIFFGGLKSLAQAATLRGSSAHDGGLAESKADRSLSASSQSSPTECGATPPSLSGGCDLACIFLKAAEAGSQAVIGEVPVVGNFLADVTGMFWPSGTDDAETVLNETLQYIDAKIADAESDVLLKNIKAGYQSLADNANTLVLYIQDDEKPDDRFNFLDGVILNGDCTHLRNQIVEYGPQVNPITLLAAIANIGQICLAMRVAEIYHYNSTVGGTPQPPNMIATFKTKLDSWVQDYMDLAGNATEGALTWRMSMIESPTDSCSGDVHDDGGEGCLSDSFATESILDNACFAAGGPPPYMAFTVGDSDGKCVCDYSFTDFVAYYQSIVTQSFVDNELPASRSLVPLWKYQTSTNLDANVKPTPVIRAATSIMDSYVKVDLQEEYVVYTFPAAEMSELYDVYNGAASQGQRMDRITDVTLWMDSGINVPLGGVVVSQVISGQSKTLQIGMGNPTDDYNSYTSFNFTLADNERIVAVGATDCGDPNFAADGSCLSIGYAFKTAYVDANGVFASEGRLWNPMGYPEDGPWIMAPPLAQARNSTFLPHVIAFHGWVTYSPASDDILLGAKVPVWLYESLE